MAYKYEQKLLVEFGNNVSIARKENNLTQQQLAEMLDVSVVTIAYIETGKRWVRIGTLNRLSKALKVSISELFIGI